MDILNSHQPKLHDTLIGHQGTMTALILPIQFVWVIEGIQGQVPIGCEVPQPVGFIPLHLPPLSHILPLYDEHTIGVAYEFLEFLCRLTTLEL